MKKAHIVKEAKDFDKAFKQRKQYVSKYYYLYIINQETDYRFGICVSKKIGNAVTRNKLKRQIKDIIDKSCLHFFNKDYIIVLKKSIINAKYFEMKDDLVSLLNKINE
ncbi:MAG: ribonuclease P protein component [Bacilli bacterium]